MLKKKSKILTHGMGESGAFCRSHPLINFVYFAVIIGITMFSNHPLFLLSSFVTAWVYSIMLKGKKAIIFNALVLLPVLLITVIFNVLKVHNGETVLFYLSGNVITLEAIVFGFVQGLMLSSVIIWFTCFSVVVTEDKFLYLFGRGMPVIALTISMILRFIPLFINRFHEITAARRCMGQSKNSKNPLDRIRQFGKSLSILISWSLEASIESADSMEARGYGLKGRTSFHLFRLTGSDLGVLVLMLLLGLVCITGCVMGYTNIYYYPTITLPDFSLMQSVSIMAFCAFLYSAVIMDIRGMYEWK
jgi:energy-coupling factor transport system permease protein